MSRSFRKPWFTDGYKGSKRRQFNKRKANRFVRQDWNIPDGKAYRKFTNTWDICDYKYLYDPKPRIWMFNGEQRIIKPTPFWRVMRK